MRLDPTLLLPPPGNHYGGPAVATRKRQRISSSVGQGSMP